MPNGDYAPYEAPYSAPPSGGGITREAYLRLLQTILMEIQQWDTDYGRAQWQRALDLLNQGYFGAGLPYFDDVSARWTKAMPPEAEPTIGGYEVETRGGYSFAVVRDEEGNITELRPLGVAEPEGLSAWQQSQVNRWQQEFEAQQQQARMQQQQAMMPYGQMTAYQRAQMELAGQAQWAETMALPASGWIEQFFRMQGGQVGYKPEPKHKRMTEQQYATRFRETIPKAREAIERWERGQGLPSISEMPLRGNWIYIDETTPTRGLITTTIKEPGVEYTPLVGYPGGYAPRPSEIGYQVVSPPKPPYVRPADMPLAAYEGQKKKKKAVVRRPTTPPAPPGLSQFVPSQVTGQPITRAPTTTPSGQMWAQTPWSTQEMLRGYTGWAGYRPYEDIMQHMWSMQPQTPAGAGRQRWQPARQWA